MVHDVEQDAGGQLGPKVAAALKEEAHVVRLLHGRELPREGLVRGPQLRGGRLRRSQAAPLLGEMGLQRGEARLELAHPR